MFDKDAQTVFMFFFFFCKRAYTVFMFMFDKSVFMFMALPEDEKKAVVAKLEQDNFG